MITNDYKEKILTVDDRKLLKASVDIIQPNDMLRQRPYPVEKLGNLKDSVEKLSGHALEYKTLPAQCLLSVLALATQRLYQVKFLPNVGEKPTSLYLLSIGASGQRKTTCFEPALKAINEVEETRHKRYQDDKRAYEANQQKKKDDQCDITEPLMDWLTISDPTLSGIMHTFAQGSHSIGLFNDDAGDFIEGVAMDKKAESDSMAKLNRAWGSGRWETTRAKHEGTWKLHNRWLSIHLMVQPEVIETLLTNKKAKGSGFLARFLIAYPTSTMGTADALITFDEAIKRGGAFELDDFNDVIRRLITHQPIYPKFTVTADNEAMRAFHDFNAFVELEIGENGRYAPIADFVRKATEQAGRIASNLMIYDYMSNDMFAKPRDLTMTKDYADMGISLVRDYYLPEYYRLLNARMGVDINQTALDLFAEIKATPEKWQTSDMGYVSQRAYARNVTNLTSIKGDIRKQAFKTLVDCGYLILDSDYKDGRGRKKHRWQINTTV